MQLYTLLARLPYTLVISSFALAASAVPVESVELTVLNPSNFKETIKEGVWCVIHSTIRCIFELCIYAGSSNTSPLTAGTVVGSLRHGHSWSRKTKNNKTQALTLHRSIALSMAVRARPVLLRLTEVDTKADLCQENKVTGYPQMNLYKDGEFIETYKQSRDLELLQEYLEKHARKKAPVVPPVHSQEEEEEAVIPVYHEVHNPDGQLISLNEKTFDETIRKGHVFVKFFAPWSVSSICALSSPLTDRSQVWSLQEARADLGPTRRPNAW